MGDAILCSLGLTFLLSCFQNRATTWHHCSGWAGITQDSKWSILEYSLLPKWSYFYFHFIFLSQFCLCADMSGHVKPTMIIRLTLSHFVWFICWFPLSVGLETLSKSLFTLFCHFINQFGQSFAHQTIFKATEVFYLYRIVCKCGFSHRQAVLV